MGIVLFTLALLCVAAVASQVMGLRRNIAKAKESGFAYLVVRMCIYLGQKARAGDPCVEGRIA